MQKVSPPTLPKPQPLPETQESAPSQWGTIQVLSTLPFASMYVAYKVFQQKDNDVHVAPDKTLNQYEINYLNSYSDTEAFLLSLPVVGTFVALYKIFFPKKQPIPVVEEKTTLKPLTFEALSGAKPLAPSQLQVSPERLGELLNTSEGEGYHQNTNISGHIHDIIAAQKDKKQFLQGFVVAIKDSADVSKPQAAAVMKWLVEHFSDVGLSRDDIEQAILAAQWVHVDFINVDARWNYVTKSHQSPNRVPNYAMSYLGNDDPHEPKQPLQAGFTKKCKEVLQNSNLSPCLDATFMSDLASAVKNKGASFFSDLFFSKGAQLAKGFIQFTPKQTSKNSTFENIEFALTLMKNSRLDAKTRIALLNDLRDRLVTIPPNEKINEREFHIVLNVLKEFNNLTPKEINSIQDKRTKEKLGEVFSLSVDLMWSYPTSNIANAALRADADKSIAMILRIYKKLEQNCPGVFPHLVFTKEEPDIKKEEKLAVKASKALFKLTGQIREQAHKLEYKVKRQSTLLSFNEKADLFATDHEKFSAWLIGKHIDFKDAKLKSAMKQMILGLPLEMRKEFIRNVAYPIWLNSKQKDLVIAFFKNIYDETHIGMQDASESFYTWAHIPSKPGSISTQEALRAFRIKALKEESVVEFWKTFANLCHEVDSPKFEKAIQRVFPGASHKEQTEFRHALLENLPESLTLKEWESWTRLDQSVFLKSLPPGMQFSNILSLGLRERLKEPELTRDLVTTLEFVLEDLAEMNKRLTQISDKTTEVGKRFVLPRIVNYVFNEETALEKRMISTPETAAGNIGWLKLYDQFCELEGNKDSIEDEEYDQKLAELMLSALVINGHYDEAIGPIVYPLLKSLDYIEAMDQTVAEFSTILDEDLEELKKQPQIPDVKAAIEHIETTQRRMQGLAQKNAKSLDIGRACDRSDQVLEKDLNELFTLYKIPTLFPPAETVLIGLKSLAQIDEWRDFLAVITDIVEDKKSSPAYKGEKAHLSELKEREKKLAERAALQIEGLEGLSSKNDELEKVRSDIRLSQEILRLYKLLMKCPPEDRLIVAQQLQFLFNKEKSNALFTPSEVGRMAPLKAPSRVYQEGLIEKLSPRVGHEYGLYGIEWEKLFAEKGQSEKFILFPHIKAKEEPAQEKSEKSELRAS